MNEVNLIDQFVLGSAEIEDPDKLEELLLAEGFSQAGIDFWFNEFSSLTVAVDSSEFEEL